MRRLIFLLVASAAVGCTCGNNTGGALAVTVRIPAGFPAQCLVVAAVGQGSEQHTDAIPISGKRSAKVAVFPSAQLGDSVQLVARAYATACTDPQPVESRTSDPVTFPRTGTTEVSIDLHALAFLTQPANVLQGQPFAQPVRVGVVDPDGAVVAWESPAVSITVVAPNGEAQLSGSTQQQASAGVAQFADLSIAQAGTGLALVAHADGFPDVRSGSFDVQQNAVVSLSFVVQPSNGTAGVALAPFQVALTGNPSSSGGPPPSVTLTLAAGPAGAQLSGTATVTSSGGVATFSDISFTKAGPGYALTASVGSVTTTSASFTISPAAIAAATSTISVDKTTAWSNGSDKVTASLTAHDAFGNPIPNAAVTFSATGSHNTWTPAGGSVNTDANGTATAALTTTFAGQRMLSGASGTVSLTYPQPVTFIPQPCTTFGFNALPQKQTGGNPQATVPGDFNGDGVLDLVDTDSSDTTFSLFANTGGGVMANRATTTLDNKPRGIATADLNGDGFLDLAVAIYASDVVDVAFGRGDGGFRSVASYRTGDGPVGVAAADFNRDGVEDLAVTNYNASTVSVLLGAGDGGFQAHTDFSTGSSGSNPVWVAAAPFRGGDVTDLAVANINGNSVAVLYGDGLGGFSSPTVIPVGIRPGAVAAVDLRGSGQWDLVASGSGTSKATGGNLDVLLSQGDGGFASNGPYATDGGGALATTDLDSDGLPDVVTANYYDDSITVFRGLGDGGLTPPIPVYGFPANSNPSAVSAADFDGDGRPDLAVTLQGTDKLQILLNQCQP